MRVQLEGQRWHLEEQQHFPVHVVDLHQKQRYCAENGVTKLTTEGKYNLDVTNFLANEITSTSNSGGGQYLTTTSCVGSGNWGRFCKRRERKVTKFLLVTSHGDKFL